MKKHILICILLAFSLMVTGCAGAASPEAVTSGDTAQIQTAEKPDAIPKAVSFPEGETVKALGLMPEGWEDDLSQPADFDAFYQMLAAFADQAMEGGAAALAQQVDPSAFPSRSMGRDDGLILLMLAAEALHYDVYNARNYGFCTENQVDYDLQFSQLSWDYPYTDAQRQISLYFPEGGEDPVGELPITAVFWMQRRMDVGNRVHFLDYREDYDFRLSDVLTRQEALAAVVRLYNSEILPYSPMMNLRQPDERDEALLAEAEQRIQEILDNPDQMACQGNAYYVSTQGSDGNDGCTPDTPWATLDAVNQAKLQPGDGVYFRRGDLWRGQLWAQEGVIYSAYGQGEKPRIYASPENGADPAKWSLLEGTQDIWVYDKPMMDCGSLVFDDGEKWGIKIAPYYLDGYRSPADPSQPFEVRKELTEDLSFFSQADSILYEGAPFRYTVMDNCDFNQVPEVTGPLYLRCQEGNPGEVFSSIEFMVRQNIVLPADDAVFHNLCLRYTGAHCIFGGDMGYDVSYCEIGWVGGSPSCYTYDTGRPIIFGNGVECDGSYDHYSVTNSYIYQCYDAGVSNQDPSENAEVTGRQEWNVPDIVQRNITYSGNVMSHNDMHIEIFFTLEDGPENGDHRMENVRIADNYLLYAGFGWYYGQLDKGVPGAYGAAYQGYHSPNCAKDFVMENNRFYLSTGGLISTGARQEWLPQLRGNTYVQSLHAPLAFWPNEEGYPSPLDYDKDAGKTVRDILGDETGTVWTD